MVFCRSSACDVLPLRAAEIASLTAAISADGIEIGTGEVAATEGGAAEPLDWALDLAFFSGVLALAALLLSLSLLAALSFSLPAALSLVAAGLSLLAVVGLSLAVAVLSMLPVFSCSAGAPPATSAWRATPSAPARASAVKNRVGA